MLRPCPKCKTPFDPPVTFPGDGPCGVCEPDVPLSARDWARSGVQTVTLSEREAHSYSRIMKEGGILDEETMVRLQGDYLRKFDVWGPTDA